MLRKVKTLVTRVLKKREAGFSIVNDGLMLLITVFAVVIVVMYSIGQVKILNDKDEISLIMRKYIIRMETNGYLTKEDNEALEHELTEVGLTEIDITGTTLEEVNYGDIIYLKVKGNLVEEVFNIQGIFEGKWNEKTVVIDEVLSSTSQR